MELLLHIFGADTLAALMVSGLFVALFGLYSFVAILYQKYFTAPAVSEVPDQLNHKAACPNCSLDFTKKLSTTDDEVLYKGYGQRSVTCECLAVSHWDILGLPMCIDWRPPTPQELRAHHEREQRRNRDQKIEELRVQVEKARKLKLKNRRA